MERAAWQEPGETRWAPLSSSPMLSKSGALPQWPAGALAGQHVSLGNCVQLQRCSNQLEKAKIPLQGEGLRVACLLPKKPYCPSYS